jgi:signal transduction histidine kinase
MALIKLPPSVQLIGYIILGILGLYSLARLLLPYFRNFRDGYPGLAVDVVFGTLPLFLTGGLASPFLFYSLCPIIYAALIFPKWVALVSAFFVSSSVVTNLFYPEPSQVNVSLVGVYVIACFLSAIMPFTSNLSIYRRLEQDAALSERKRLARELHDTVAQALAYINIKANLVTETLAKGNLERGLKELAQIKESLDSTYEVVRHAINTLGRSPLETVDFVSALSHQVKEFSRKSNVRSSFSVSGDRLHLSPQIADELLRIVGEALVNVRNHAQARSVEVRLSTNRNRLGVTVEDDGRGFDLSDRHNSLQDQDHHGLVIMRERAESLGGELELVSTPGNGTEIKVNVPVGVNDG